MNKNILAIFIAVAMGLITQSSHSQVKTKYGDETATLDGIIKAYYDVVCVKKGGKVSYERDSLLHIPGVVMVGAVEKDKSGKKELKMISLSTFHRLFDPGSEQHGFYEHEIGRRTEKFGNIYHVFSAYESMDEQGGKPKDRGINSIELYNDGKRFWIVSWIFDTEGNGNTIPKEYLNK